MVVLLGQWKMYGCMDVIDEHAFAIRDVSVSAVVRGEVPQLMRDHSSCRGENR
jgi:hypothetical protein